MQISVFGLGYVGCVTAASFAKEGHNVIGVDINRTKTDMINDGRSPIVEPGLGPLIESLISRPAANFGTLAATTDSCMAVKDSDVSLVCVGTPSNANGSLDLDHVLSCVREIGHALRNKRSRHTIVLRSTVLPGSISGEIAPLLEAESGLRIGNDIGLAMNPEFLRESTSLEDFYNPAVTIIGEHDTESGDVVEKMFDFLDAPVVRTSLGIAETVKYANNAFHALKVSFANEIGTLCKSLGVDSHVVMDILCMDQKLNLSGYYLKPGFAFGGSCLPKDLRAINYKAKELDVDLPLLGAILPSNRLHVERAIDMVLRSGRRKVAMLGLSFKAGTDDLRESPIVTLAEALIGKGLDLRVYDENVLLARLTGANKEYIESQIPHISSLMVESAEEAVGHAELVVIANHSERFTDGLKSRNPGTLVLDLVRLQDIQNLDQSSYEGICW